MSLIKSYKELHWIFIPYRRNIIPSPSKEFRLPLEKEKYKVFSAKFVLHSLPSETLISKCPKKNKTYTILISVQVYSSNLWVNFGLQKLRISKNSKLESCRYLSHGSNPSALCQLNFWGEKYAKNTDQYSNQIFPFQILPLWFLSLFEVSNHGNRS